MWSVNTVPNTGESISRARSTALHGVWVSRRSKAAAVVACAVVLMSFPSRGAPAPREPGLTLPVVTRAASDHFHASDQPIHPAVAVLGPPVLDVGQLTAHRRGDRSRLAVGDGQVEALPNQTPDRAHRSARTARERLDDTPVGQSGTDFRKRDVTLDDVVPAVAQPCDHRCASDSFQERPGAVSYTHLTLPTKR